MIHLVYVLDLYRVIYSLIYYILSIIHFLRFVYGFRFGYSYIWILMANDAINKMLGVFPERCCLWKAWGGVGS